MARTVYTSKPLTGRALAEALALAMPFPGIEEGPQEAEPEPTTEPELVADIDEARNFPEGFRAWAKHWRFVNRETGKLHTFRNPWPGQSEFMDLMIRVARRAVDAGDWYGIFALKAGKLGFTELECAWDGYVAWSQPNARVHLFSKEQDASKEMLTYVRTGLRHLERPWGVRFVDTAGREIDWQKAGAQHFRFTVLRSDGSRDWSDTRNVVAFATSKYPAINDSAQHAHVDEWAHMEDPQTVWGSVNTTIAPGGTAHIVTRGAGEHKAVEDTWQAALAGESKLASYFAPWSARPDRDERWYREQAASTPTQALLAHYAAETPEDAFLGDEDNDFVPIEAWDACRDQYLVDHPLLPGDRTPAVIGADAATSHDTFGLVLVTRHPLRPEDPAIRLKKLWRPDMFEDGRIDYDTVEAWLRAVCLGGCALGHPRDHRWFRGAGLAKLKGQTWEPGECPACASGQSVEAFNILQIAFDPWQLTDMMQSLTKDAVVWCKEISQGKDRGAADRTFFDVIVGRRLSHTGDADMREHVANAKSKTVENDDSKLRIVKKAQHRKIDLTVAASMGVKECLRLNL